MKKIVILISLLFFTFICKAQLVEGRKYSNHYLLRYEAFEKERPINKNDIVFLGNSLTQGGEWSVYFPHVEAKLAKNGGGIINRGIIGDDAIGMYDRLNQILPGKPKKIFLLVGVNDVSHNLSPNQIIINIERVVERIRRESPKTKLYIESLLPFNSVKNRYKAMNGKSDAIKEVNILLEELTKKYKLKFINLYPHFVEPGTDELIPQLTNDGLHINSEGYKIWVEQLKNYVK